MNALVRRRPIFGMDGGGTDDGTVGETIGGVKSPSTDCCSAGRPLGNGTDAAAANAAAAAWSSRWCNEKLLFTCGCGGGGGGGGGGTVAAAAATYLILATHESR